MLRVGKSKLKALAAAATLAAPAITLAQTNGTWSFQGNGNWSVVGNWVNNASPASGAGTLANFGGYAVLPSSAAATVIRNINMDAARTLGRIDFIHDSGSFSGTGGYNITGASVISLANLNGDIVTLNADGGTHRIAANITTIGATFHTKVGAGTIVLAGTGNNFNNQALGINDGVVVAGGPGSVGSLVAIATANGAVFQIGDGGAGIAGAMGNKVIGLGAVGAPNGTVRVSGGTANTMTGNWFILANGTLNAATGTNLSIAGNIFDSLDATLNGFTKAGAGSFTANGLIINGNLNNIAGDFILTGAATLSSNVGTANITGGNLNITGGTFGTTNGAFINGGALNVSGTGRHQGNTTVTTGNLTNSANIVGTTTVNGGTFTNSGTHTGNVTVGGGTFILNGGTVNSVVTVNTGTALFNGGRLSTLAVNGGTARMVQGVPANAPARVLRMSALNLAGGATPTRSLDITNNSLVIDTANTAAGLAAHNLHNAQILNANNAFAWDQPGITSSVVPTDLGANIPTGIGLVWNNDGGGGAIFYGDGGALPQFQGQTVNENSILIKYTYIGDADLNGVVDSNDFGLFQFGFVGAPYTSWAFGDFDYNSVVDSNDFGLFQFGFVGQGAALSPELAMAIVGFGAENGMPVLDSIAAAVPEPATVGLASMAMLGMLGRRRRRN